MQHMSHARLCQQAEQLADSYEHLRKSYVGACLIKALWTPELSAYLREERYLESPAHEYLGGIIEVLEAMQEPTRQLAYDHQNLCNDLLRVGRGESFSV